MRFGAWRPASLAPAPLAAPLKARPIRAQALVDPQRQSVAAQGFQATFPTRCRLAQHD
jgi:hypothetical protein